MKSTRLKMLTVVLAALFAIAGASYVALSRSSTASIELLKAVMYKPLQCGCCDEYAKYLERNGFAVEVNSMRSLASIRRTTGIPEGFEGCHTLFVGGYAVDGLVPVTTLQKLLEEKPAVAAITLPGMPWGAPGMEKRPKEGPLVIYAFEAGSSVPRVYARE